MNLFCWIFGHRFTPLSEPVGTDRTAWHMTVICTRCAETKRFQL